jgi:hypothetical protein
MSNGKVFSTVSASLNPTSGMYVYSPSEWALKISSGLIKSCVAKCK